MLNNCVSLIRCILQYHITSTPHSISWGYSLPNLVTGRTIVSREVMFLFCQYTQFASSTFCDVHQAFDMESEWNIRSIILIVCMIILFRNSMDRRQTIYWTRLVHSYCEGVLYLDVNISKDMQNTCFKCPVSQCIGLEHMEIGCARNISKFCICSDCINRIS